MHGNSRLRVSHGQRLALLAVTDTEVVVLLVILLVVLALAAGALGIIIKGAFWLFVLTVLFLVGAFFAGRASRT
jgi:hypothetical protein